MSFFKSYERSDGLIVLVTVRGASEEEKGCTDLEIATRKDGVFLSVTMCIPEDLVWKAFETISEESALNVAGRLLDQFIGEDDEGPES